MSFTADPGPEGGLSRAPTVAVFVGSWLPYSETFIYDQVRQLRQMRGWIIAGARTRHAQHFPYSPITHLGHRARLGFRHLGVARCIDDTLKRSGARVVLAHFGLNGAFALPFARRCHLPLVVMFHGHDVGGLLPCNRLTARYFRYQRLASSLFEYASLVLCASKDIQSTLAELGAPSHKLRLQHLGIDLDRFTAPNWDQRTSAPTLLMVGRLVEKKGMIFGLRAFRRVRARFSAARLTIVGDGPLRGALTREAQRLGIGDAVRFCGSLPHQGVLEEMQKAHVMLTPSITTSHGDRESGVIALKEAAASGLPAVATRHGGIPEIIDHERTGLLVPERSVEDLARALERLLGDPSLARELGRVGREKMFTEYDNRKQVALLERRLLDVAGLSPEVPSNPRAG
jgi:colanic acid/amylovoran biosynthesis glycosyltransferase